MTSADFMGWFPLLLCPVKCNASSADLNLHYLFTKHKCFDNLCTSFLLVQAYNPKDIHSDSLFLCQYMYRINIALGRVHIHSQLQQIKSNGDKRNDEKRWRFDENAHASYRIILRSKTLIAAQLFNSDKDTDRKIEKEPLKKAKEMPYISGEAHFNHQKKAFYSIHWD